MGSINPPDKQPIQSRWIWTKLNCKTACILSGFRLGWVAKSIISSFFVILSNTIFLLCSFAHIFDKVLELFVLLTASWLLILPWFLQELIWFLSWLKRKTYESELTHNSTLSCIRVRTFMKLFFFIYTKMTFLIVNPSERWFIKLTLHFLLTTQLTSPINNQFN